MKRVVSSESYQVIKKFECKFLGSQRHFLVTALYTRTCARGCVRAFVVCACVRACVYIRGCAYVRRDLTTRQLSLAVYAVNE